MSQLRKFILSGICSVIAFSNSSGQGILRGKITDTNGETLIGVIISLKSNRSVGTSTDLDGNYSFKLPDSVAQTILVSYIGYKTIEESIRFAKGDVIIRNFILNSALDTLNVVEVVAKAVKGKDYYMEKLKQNSSTTIDYISSETMKKTGDANVVAAVARVSGVSTNGNSGFITVRGIGDRYVKTTINGSRIPTLDPFTNNIKLDLFPASLVDNIIITKTASPDLPGDWAGAYLSVETKDYPEQLAVNVETSFGYNGQSTFKDVITSQRSSTDWLGFDNGFRDHNHRDYLQVIDASEITSYQQLVALGLGDYYKSIGVTGWSGMPGSDNSIYFRLGLVELGLLDKAKIYDDNAFTAANTKYISGSYAMQAFNTINAEAVKSGQSFPNNWNTSYRKAPLNFSQGFSIGNQTTLFGKPLGVLAGFRYGSSIAYDANATANRATILDPSAGVTSITNSSTEQSSKESNGWSALANIAFKPDPNNSISLLFMPNYTGTNNVRYNVNTADPVELSLNKSQFYEERRQLIYQLKSEHYIPGPKMKIELNASYTAGKSSAPDFKNLPYTKDRNTDSYGIGQGMNRSYRYLTENLFDSHVSGEFPLREKAGLPRKFKFGGAYQELNKDYDQYDYTTRYGSYANTTLSGGKIDDFFSLDKFGISSGLSNGTPYSTVDIRYLRVDNPASHTFGFSKTSAVFAMIDYSILPVLRVEGGIRIEQAKMFTDAFKYNALGWSDNDLRRQFPGEVFTLHPGRLNEISYLPSANVIYKLKNDELSPVNLRLNYSKTVARPSIRELSEVVVMDFDLRAFVYGNPDLKMVEIDNYDLRLESYFRNGDNVSLSLFYKNFKNHIEIGDAPFGYTWINVDKSYVKGIELEARKSLTRRFELRANVTFVDSRTNYLHKTILIANGLKTYIPVGNVSRTMYGQAPYVINTIFGYKEDSLGLTMAISYNVQGPRLVINNFNKQLEVHELPRHLFDFKVTKTLGKHFSFSLTVKDILNSPIRRSYNFNEGWLLDYDNYQYGTNFILGLSYKL